MLARARDSSASLVRIEWRLTGERCEDRGVKTDVPPRARRSTAAGRLEARRTRTKLPENLRVYNEVRGGTRPIPTRAKKNFRRVRLTSASPAPLRILARASANAPLRWVLAASAFVKASLAEPPFLLSCSPPSAFPSHIGRRRSAALRRLQSRRGVGCPRACPRPPEHLRMPRTLEATPRAEEEAGPTSPRRSLVKVPASASLFSAYSTSNDGRVARSVLDATTSDPRYVLGELIFSSNGATHRATRFEQWWRLGWGAPSAHPPSGPYHPWRRRRREPRPRAPRRRHSRQSPPAPPFAAAGPDRRRHERISDRDNVHFRVTLARTGGRPTFARTAGLSVPLAAEAPPSSRCKPGTRVAAPALHPGPPTRPLTPHVVGHTHRNKDPRDSTSPNI